MHATILLQHVVLWHHLHYHAKLPLNAATKLQSIVALGQEQQVLQWCCLQWLEGPRPWHWEQLLTLQTDKP